MWPSKKPINLTGNQGPILDTSGNHAWLDVSATTSSTWVAAGWLETSGTISPRVADDIVAETGKKGAGQMPQASLPVSGHHR